MAPILYITQEQLENAFKILTKAPLLFCQAALKNMKPGGRIINITSISGITGDPGIGSYGAAKVALDSLTRTMAIEMGGRNITVNAIAPGLIYTSMTKNIVDRDIYRLRLGLHDHRI